MTRPRAIVRVVALVLVTLGLANASLARDTRYKIIVHPRNPVTTIDRELLRNAFLKRGGEWSHGDTIRPVDLPARFPARAQFTHDVLRKTGAQLRSYWSQQIFSGKGTPPPEANAPDDVIAYVLANRGAVGYVPSDADTRGAKVIEVR